MTRTYYVTTPIYYVNDSPHIGHSYTTVAADVLARYHRAEGRDVRFLTGTDEHGIKIVKAAAEKGMTPKELADSVVVHFEQMWKDLGISNDDFIRTSQARHERRVQELVRMLLARDEVYLGKYEGWYDEGQEEFVTENTARANEFKSPITGKGLVRHSEDAYFFRLSKWAPKLIEHIKSNPYFLLPEARRNEILSKLEMGVEDQCISRLAAKVGGWGITWPDDGRFTAWVWLDALSNYYTALGLPEMGLEDDGKFKQYWPASVHLIGKDILWFHGVHWPCFLMAMNIELPKCIFAHGWWTADGKKMSKSLGNFVSREVIAEICGRYTTDVYRWYLLRAVNFGGDGDFSLDALAARYNSELANGVGNLLNRTVNMIGRYFDGAVPSLAAPGAEEEAIVAAAAELNSRAPAAMAACAFHDYLDMVSRLVGAANTYIDRTAPFKLAKDPAKRDRLAAIMGACAEAVRIILLYLRPVMPNKADVGLAQLGQAASDQPLSEQGRWGAVAAGKAQNAQPLFPRIE